MAVPIVIHVNTHTLRRNAKTGERQPPIAVRRGRTGKAAYRMEFNWPGGRVTYQPDRKLPCGATVWIELYQEPPHDGR